MAEDVSKQLVALHEVSRTLSETSRIEDVKAIRDQAEAVRVYCKSALTGLDIQNRAAEIRLRAERRAGQLLAKLNLRGGDRKSNGNHRRLTLLDLGITNYQSKCWQKEARVSQEVFEQYIWHTRSKRREVTSAGLMRLAAEQRPASASAEYLSPGLQVKPADWSVEDEVREARNHLQVLWGILDRHLDSPQPIDLTAVERRHARRMLDELEQLLIKIAGTLNERDCNSATIRGARGAGRNDARRA